MDRRCLIFAAFLSFWVIYLFIGLPLTEAKSVHLEYEWAESSVNPFLNETAELQFTKCFGCHKSMGVGGAVHQAERKYCEDCHVPGQSGPFVYYEPATLYLNFNYNITVSKAYYHVANLSSAKVVYKYQKPVFIESQANKTGGNGISSCFDFNSKTGEGTCHGVSSLNSTGSYFGFNVTGSPAGQVYHHTVEKSYLPDSKNCLYCHAQSNPAVVKAFASPSQVNASHFNAVSNEQCYSCHVDPSINLTSFNFHVMGPEPEIIYIQAPPATPPPPTLPPPETLPPETPAPTTLPPITTPPPTTTQPPETQPPETTPAPTTSPPPQPPAPKLPVALILAAGAAIAVIIALVYLIKKRKAKGP